MRALGDTPPAVRRPAPLDREQPEDGRTPLHVWDYLRILSEGRRILAISIGVTLGVALVGTLLMPKLYRATSLVEIDLKQTSILGTETEKGAARSFFDQDRQFKTEFIKIQSRPLLQRAIEAEGLATVVPALGQVKDPVKLLQRRVSVDLVPQTNAVKIAVLWDDPQIAALLTNAVTKTYVAWDLLERETVLKERAERLRGSADEKKVGRRAALEHELAVVRSRPGVDELLGLEAFADDARLVDLKSALSEVEQELEGMRATYGGNHELVREQAAEREALRRQVEDLVSAVDARLTSELTAMGGDPATVRRHDGTVETRQRDAEKDLEAKLLKTYEDNLVLTKLLEPKARIIEVAQPPDTHHSPNLRLNAMLALVVGLGFGTGLAFFRDYLDSAVKTIQDVEHAVGLNLLAVVPAGEATTRVRLESFQTLRTGLLFASAGRRDTVVLVTSAAPREGKSHVVAGLAQSLAASGESVAVLECDLRRPAAARLLGVTAQRGLANYLADQSQEDWRQFGVQVSEHLYVLPTGPIPPNPLDLLSLPKFAELLEHLEAAFDWVVLDSPPVSSVSDSVVLASLVQMVLFVIRHDATDKEVVRRAVSRLEAVGARVVGAVLNGVDMSKSYNRDYYYGRYYYGQYYGQEAEETQRPGLLAGFLKRTKG